VATDVTEGRPVSLSPVEEDTLLRRLDALLDRLTHIHSRRDLGEALPMLAQGLLERTGFVRVGISLVLPSGDHQLVALAGPATLADPRFEGRILNAQAWDELAAAAVLEGRLLRDPRTGTLIARMSGSEGRLIGLMGAAMPRGVDASRRERRLLEYFALHAALTIDKVRSQGALVQNVVLRERERTADDLHDLVAQRLFAAALELNGALRLGVSDEVRGRIDAVLDNLDEVSTRVRGAIRSITRDPAPAAVGEGVERATLEALRTLGFAPEVTFSGDLHGVNAYTGAALQSVLEKALSAIAVEAAATSVLIHLSVTDVSVALEVVETGAPVDLARRAAAIGLADLQRRVTLARGECSLAARQPGGSMLRWSVPNA